MPCVGNGDIWELDDVMTMRRETGVRGVMAARGLLANPVSLVLGLVREGPDARRPGSVCGLLFYTEACGGEFCAVDDGL